MRQRKPDESEDEYKQALIAEYGLLESDIHYGNVYGLPRASLTESSSEIPVIRTDIFGAITLKRILQRDMNVIVVAIFPDSLEEAANRVRTRDAKIQVASDETAQPDERIVADGSTLPLYA